MWYKTASVSSDWSDLANLMAEMAEESVRVRLSGKVLPNQGIKLADEFRDMFIKKASQNEDLRHLPSKNPDAYDNLKYQIELYAALTYRGIAQEIDQQLADSITDDMEETLNNRKAVVQQAGDSTRKATLGLAEYIIRGGPKFVVLEEARSRRLF